MNNSNSEHIKALPPQETNKRKQRFSEWLERAAHALCEHCVVDNRGHPVCLYIYNLPAYCVIENCPYLEDQDQ